MNINYSEEYLGRRIVVLVTEVKPGLFTWTYTIDGHHEATGGGDQMPTAEMARDDALGRAKWIVDQWSKAKPKG
jgi:hypothetical protein